MSLMKNIKVLRFDKEVISIKPSGKIERWHLQLKVVLVFAIVLLCFCLGSCNKNEKEDKDVAKLLKSRYNKEFEVIYIEEMKSGHPFTDNFFRGEAREVCSNSKFNFTLDRHGKLLDNYYSTYSKVSYPEHRVVYKETDGVYSSPEEYLSDYNVEIWISLEATQQNLKEVYDEVADICNNPYDVSASILIDNHVVILAHNKTHKLKTYEEVLEECML